MEFSEINPPKVGTRVRIVACCDDRYKNGDCGVVDYELDYCSRVLFDNDGESRTVYYREMEPEAAISVSAASPALRLLAETLLKLTVREMHHFVLAYAAAENDGGIMKSGQFLATADRLLKAA